MRKAFDKILQLKMSPVSVPEKLASRLPKNVDYHVYAAYSHKNDGDLVQPILGVMESLGVKVYDPDRDFVIGELVLKNIVDRGISVCKTTILFLTKNFVASTWCHYEANIALKRYIMTKGKYRVIPVLLQPCAVPKYMKILNCVHAWKYEGREVLKRIMKSLTAPSLKYRHIRWIGVSAYRKKKDIVKKWRLAFQNDQDVPLSLFSLAKLPAIMRHSILHCRYGRCQFMCAGKNYLQMHKHVRYCRYLPVKCQHRDCLHCCPRHEIDKHMKNCKYKITHCPFEGCNAKVPQYKLDLHKNTCGFQIVHCINLPNGCPQTLLRGSLKEHLKTCEFCLVSCNDCDAKFIGKYKNKHICDNAFVICPECGLKEQQSNFYSHNERCLTQKVKCKFKCCTEILPRRDMKDHEQHCQYRTVRCRNVGCDFEGYEEEILFHMTICDFRQWVCEKCRKELLYKNKKGHSLKCDPLVACADCGAYITSSSKLTHERFICPKRQIVSMCEICETSVPFDKKDIHAEAHRLRGDNSKYISMVQGHCLENGELGNHRRKQDAAIRSAVFNVGSFKNNPDGASGTEKPRSASDPEYSLESALYILSDKTRTSPRVEMQYKDDKKSGSKKSSSVLKFRELMRNTDKYMGELKTFHGKGYKQ